ATMGLSPRYHPLGLLRQRLPDGLTTTAELATTPDGYRIRMAGLTVCRQRPGTANGITFLLLEDEFGLVNVVVFPDLYSEHRHVVRGEPFLLIEGILQRRRNTINLVAETITTLDQARSGVLPLPANDAPTVREIDVIAARAARSAAVDPALVGATQEDVSSLRGLSPASHNYR
ncbi:MAG: OB-fold nucleic acid binding domain-containing protein, partial [Chloroflexota bacterium]